MAFEWTKNLACGSCYKILGELQQFDAAKVSFKKAASLKVSSLNYWPVSSKTPDALELSAQLLTQSYIPLLAKYYVLKPQNNAKWKHVRRAMQQVLVDKDKTVTDLAEVIDDRVKFEDE